MPDFDDDLSFRGAPAAEPPPPPAGPPLWPLIAIAALGAALGALWYFGSRGSPPPPAAVTQKGVTQTTVELKRGPGEPGEAIDLPPLDQSDGVVRELVSRLSSHPLAAAWLTTNGLVRNLTVAIVNVAGGETPAKHLRPLRPAGAFAVKESRGLTWIDPASYARYDGIAAAVEGLDARGVARFYATIKPRVDDAYRDLGAPGGDLDRTLERAIEMLLRTPIVDDDIQVRAEKMSYVFVNPALQDLTRAQRQFLRMGPRNMRIVKAKLREVAGYLGIPDAALPPPDGR
jgi:hypothetical protein